MFEFLGSKGDRRGEQVIFSDFKYHLQKMLKSKNLLQFNVSKIILRYFTAYTAQQLEVKMYSRALTMVFK